jgi:hypothetical protein
VFDTSEQSRAAYGPGQALGKLICSRNTVWNDILSYSSWTVFLKMLPLVILAREGTLKPYDDQEALLDWVAVVVLDVLVNGLDGLIEFRLDVATLGDVVHGVIEGFLNRREGRSDWTLEADTTI